MPDLPWLITDQRSIELSNFFSYARKDILVLCAEIARLKSAVIDAQQHAHLPTCSFLGSFECRCIEKEIARLKRERHELAGKLWRCQDVLLNSRQTGLTLSSTLYRVEQALSENRTTSLALFEVMVNQMREFAERPCGMSVTANMNCDLAIRQGDLVRKCYSCEARAALAALERRK